jgi:hypothetical protein
VPPLGVVAVMVVRDAARYDENDVGKVLGIHGRDNAAGRQSVALAVVEDRAEGHRQHFSTGCGPVLGADCESAPGPDPLFGVQS